MKKIGAVIAVATFMTIGGVYATFNYAQQSADTVEQTLGLTIANEVSDTTKGVITITSTFAIEIDDAGQIAGGESTYFTGMKTSGEFKITFTPAVGADADVRENGIVLEMEITMTGNAYNGADIFKTKGLTENKVTLNQENKILGDYIVDLTNYIEINPIQLSTSAEYNAYKAQLEATSILVKVSEKA